jgi:Peptidase family C78
LESNSSSAFSVLCDPRVSHFAFEIKTLGWGCGYNNIQMLLSYMKEASPDDYRRAFGEDIPSIRRIQNLIEAGWAKGCNYWKPQANLN